MRITLGVPPKMTGIIALRWEGHKKLAIISGRLRRQYAHRATAVNT